MVEAIENLTRCYNELPNFSLMDCLNDFEACQESSSSDSEGYDSDYQRDSEDINLMHRHMTKNLGVGEATSY